MRRILLILLLSATFPLVCHADLRGKVVDPSGAVIPRARVALYGPGPGRALVARAVADDAGVFFFAGVAPGSYELVVDSPDMARSRRAVTVLSNRPGEEIEIKLQLAASFTTVTVTPARGEVQDAFALPVAVNVILPEQMNQRPGVILPQALREEAGVYVQQTTAHQGSPVVRGLAGQHVLHLFDGVRFNNSTFRPGPNQYLAMVDPGSIESVEVVRGPGSAQYGSDSLGGTVNLLSLRPPLAAATGREFHATLRPFFRSVDLTGGAHGQASFGSNRWNLLFSGGGQRVQDLRAGGGRDSHAAVTRFLGLPSGLLGSRLQDTGFTQYGGHARFGWNPAPDQHLTLAYHRGEQLGGRRYDQLNGGNGNLVNAFDPQTLNLFYARYEKRGLGRLDSLSTTFSVNDQLDGRRFQGGSGNPLAPITRESNRTRALGYQAQATTHLGPRNSLAWGGEIYDEFIGSRALALDPARGLERAERSRYPDGSRYTSYGLFAQQGVELLRSRLRLQGGLRYSAFHFRTFADRNPLTTDGLPTVPDFSTLLDDLTFNAGAVLHVTESFWLTGTVGRGFRAPNVSDFASVGLTSNGFEVSPEEARKAGALLGSTGDAGAVSTGRAAGQLLPESAMNYELGARFQARRATASLGVFHYTISDFITKQTLLLAPGAVGGTIAGQPIVAQAAGGAVFTALDARPVLVRANAGRVRVRGLETSVQAQLTASVFARAYFAYLRGVDVESGRPPDSETGLPPANGYLSLRWQPASRPFWIEVYSHLAARQDRLSPLELSDQRIGALRSRAAIAAFFRNGAAARGLVRDGRLLPTGETLARVQDRVLGPGVDRAPMFLATPGYGTVNLRGGYRLGERSEVTVILENLADRNYRVHGSGVDGAGFNLQVGYSFRF